MLEVQGKIEWMSTLEVDTNKPGIVHNINLINVMCSFISNDISIGEN